MLSRRQFAFTLASSVTPAFAQQRAPVRSIPIALQLFSVRNQCARDLPATLARVKQIGFTGVELAGDYGHTAAQFRHYLDDHDLACCGAHVGFDQLSPPKYQATVDFMQTLGNKKVIVPGLPGKYTQTLAGWRDAAALFTNLSHQLRTAGFDLGYHNHAVEFKSLDGERPIDVFLKSAPDVFLELDLGGAGYGGASPVEVLESYPQRVKMIHAKDYTATKPDLLIGSGSMDWPGLFRAAAHSAIDWYVIEHDSISGPDLADIADSYARFKGL